jgi:hypothetical protein
VIRPATGDELTQLGLKNGVILLFVMTFFPIGLEFDTTNFPGFILMPQTPKTALALQCIYKWRRVLFHQRTFRI